MLIPQCFLNQFCFKGYLILIIFTFQQWEVTFDIILSRYTTTFYMLTCIFDVFLGRILNIAAFGSNLYISKKVVHGNEKGDIIKVVMAGKNALHYFYTQVCSIHEEPLFNAGKRASKFVFLKKKSRKKKTPGNLSFFKIE